MAPRKQTKAETITPEQEEKRLADFDQQILGVIKSGKANLDAPDIKEFIKQHPRLVPADVLKKVKAAPAPKKGKAPAAKTGTTKPEPKKEQKKEEKQPTPPPAPPVAPSLRGVGRPGAFDKVQILTVKLPPEDVVKLKVKAAEQGKTVAQVIHDWLNRSN